MDKPIYALSIKQPWAWLICKGFKDIENRDWFIGRKVASKAVNFTIKLPLRIYVHAGASQSEFNQETMDWIKVRLTLENPQGKTWREVCSFGAIIGEATITGCVTESKSPWFVGKYGFTLADPVLYEHPIPCRGALGFWEVDPQIIYQDMADEYNRAEAAQFKAEDFKNG